MTYVIYDIGFNKGIFLKKNIKQKKFELNMYSSRNVLGSYFISHFHEYKVVLVSFLLK
jgi:hypothetical protein